MRLKVQTSAAYPVGPALAAALLIQMAEQNFHEALPSYNHHDIDA